MFASVQSRLTIGMCVCVALLSIAKSLPAQALTPEEARKHFKVADGFEVQLFASEPDVRQPLTMTFDARGRMWVIQYLQYPAPAGLKPVDVDRYLRTKYDRVPEPPPKGPRGADKITILEDTDGDGRVDKTKDFVGGLNLASALALGNGGVYVAQAPYLLFYPDRDGDDVPDGDPEVLLTGFGLDDAHAVVNSIQWGPDGWLYGAQGSTVTANIRGIGFQQGIWRYHPASKRFELFSEGGGNTWGLDFDRHGNVIAGTNWGDALCLHQVQGGYYIKGFSKHGPLHNPHTYGYFEHVKHEGHAGGHVTCGGIVYQGGAFPETFRNAYIGPNLLSNAVYWSTLEADRSTFKTRYVDTLLSTDDIWFRPIDSLTGPDGSVFVADWYDQRANHVIPEDTWDKSNGRIWKLIYRGTKQVEKFDLSKRSSDELVDLLSNGNAWYPREARRILSERKDPAILSRLERMIFDSTDEHLALEALWAFYVSGGWNDAISLRLLDHVSADVRAWTVRLVGDEQRRTLPKPLHARLVQLASSEPSATVRSQLACTCKRLCGADGLPIVEKLWRHNEDVADLHIPLLLWWAVEDKAITDRDRVLEMFSSSETWRLPLIQGTIVERLAQRYMAEQSDAGYVACARLLAMAPRRDDVRLLVSGMEQGLSGRRLSKVPAALEVPLAKLWHDEGMDPTLTRFALRLGNPEAFASALTRMANIDEPQAVRLAFIAAVGQAAVPQTSGQLVALLDETQKGADTIRLATLVALEHFSDEAIAAQILSRYAQFAPAVRTRAVSVLCSRKGWSLALVEAVIADKLELKDVSIDQVRQMLAHDDAHLAAAIEKKWGKIRSATPGEKQAYVPVLGRLLNDGKGDLESGHQLFVKHCATCHALYGEGNKVGPDLTSADRKNRDALLVNILDPSGYVRPEFVAQTAVLNDGRILTGLVVASSAQDVTIVDAKNQRSTIARGEIEQIQPSSLSLMPERLLETLAPQELRDLFRYLQSDGPVSAAGK